MLIIRQERGAKGVEVFCALHIRDRRPRHAERAEGRAERSDSEIKTMLSPASFDARNFSLNQNSQTLCSHIHFAAAFDRRRQR